MSMASLPAGTSHAADDLAVRMNLLREMREEATSATTTTTAAQQPQQQQQEVPNGLLQQQQQQQQRGVVVTVSGARFDEVRGGEEEAHFEQQLLRRERAAEAAGGGGGVGAGTGTGTGTGGSNDREAGRTLARITVLFYLPQFIACFVVFAQYVDTEKCDNHPIVQWMVFFAAYIATVLSLIWSHQVSSTPTESQRLRRLRGSVDSLGVVILITGASWVASAGDCSETAPHIYSLCVVLISINLFVTFLPFILIMILLPFACFCLPCLIRLIPRLRNQSRNKGATKEQIRSLPATKYKAVPTNDPVDADSAMEAGTPRSVDECSICLMAFEDGDEIRVLSCNAKHFFHKECADSWFVLNASCPVCRTELQFPSPAAVHPMNEGEATLTSPSVASEASLV